MSKAAQRLSFPGSQGHALAARLELPLGTPCAYALFAHGFSLTKNVLTAVRLSEALTARGIAVLRFDFTGLGESEGDFAQTNFSSNVADLKQAAAFLREHYQAPQLLIGHSLGGAAVLSVACDIPDVRAVATLNAPSDPSHVSHLFKDVMDEIHSKGKAEISMLGRKITIQKQFLDDIAEQNLLDRVARLRRPLMICHSPVDTVVDIKHAAHIYKAAKHPKNFISLDDADHMVSRPADAEYVAGILSGWAARYLDAPPASAQPQPEGVTVAESGEGRYSQTVQTGRHWLHADEPQSHGGKDLGPSPYEFVLAGLGACTAMTLRMYAERKKLPLEHVSVQLRHDKIHAEDCEDCETRAGRIDRIEREITLTGELDDEQRRKLLEIADKCPVHRTLHSEVSVRTRLVEE